MAQTLSAAYDRLVQAGTLTTDPAQRAALDALQAVLGRLNQRQGLFRRRVQARGLYLWGPPGRGKSMLMDLFYQAAPQPKRRAHFHAFMAEVHELIRTWREGDPAQRRAAFGSARGDDPIPPVAERIAREARLLCFDELQVTDIADAMILGRLFQALFARGVTLVATSNRAPQDLYRDGINRQLFLPFIDMIRTECDVVQLSGARDWRLDRLRGAQTYFVEEPEGFEACWGALKGGETEEPHTLTVKGRTLTLDRTAGGLARATFDQLCEQPLGPSDYLAVAEAFHTLFLEGVPHLDPSRREAARRFVTLIDALYEARARLVVLAEAAPDDLYPQGTGAFEFQRTASRLHEMASADYLERTGQERPE
ncbi:cell division protein ZapE [Brevundimonas sp. 2R-24]|uniref:Cell division protein ZapE n=1 Tax=Peiella sedimenti TaxID=3061083 RepID=A0ABT8SPA1_9CAUL|nr:cell division protein ZapE [Caulobacteraceae bacterium XZ-24]